MLDYFNLKLGKSEKLELTCPSCSSNDISIIQRPAGCIDHIVCNQCGHFIHRHVDLIDETSHQISIEEFLLEGCK